ncbi:hypothetical protein ACT80S_06485 [Ramlibacter sp. MAHUQ-53]|uniref:hypothetical protein n=1 Tax=unclassified Ramlibacter TaxID=2617605 RepID=UPI003641BA09
MPREQTHVFKPPAEEVCADLTRRAKVAWFASEADAGHPDDTSGYVTFKGLGYVVLRHAGMALAVYRVRSDNLMLRRMKRPPKGLA